MRLASWVAVLGFQMAAAATTTANKATVQASDNAPEGANDDALELGVSDSASAMSLEVVVVPLTSGVGRGQSPLSRSIVNIHANIVATDSANVATVRNDTIAFVSCDESDGDSKPADLVNTLMDASPKPKAIILYSRDKNYCSLGGDYSYNSVLTMSDAGDSISLASFMASGVAPFAAAVTGNTSDTENGGETNGGNDASTGATQGHSMIAMAILYSITGLVASILLVFLIMGGMRARSNPERYGPRVGVQSRARGIARAMLDMLPIVQFGRQQPGDLENNKLDALQPEREDNQRGGSRASDNQVLQERGDQEQGGVPEMFGDQGQEQSGRRDGSNTDDGTSTEPQPGRPEQSTQPQDAVASQDANIAATPNTTQSTPQADHAPNCSICTEDFVYNEDVRVLPCQHQFHPACVDPWLLNVSGTCPLCRLDLRKSLQPPARAPEGQEPVSSPSLTATPTLSPPTLSPPELPPPLDADNDTPETSTPQRRRVSAFLRLGSIRHAPPDQHMAAFRQFLQEVRGAPSAAGTEGPEEASRRARLARSLRDRFRIHTRAHAG